MAKKKDDKGRQIIDLGEVKEEDLSIFDATDDAPPFGDDAPPFGGGSGDDAPPFGGDAPPFGGGSGDDAPPFGGDAPPFGDDAPPFGDDAPPFDGGPSDEASPGFGGVVNSAELDSAIQRVVELENTLSKLDSSLTVIKKRNEETVERVSGLDKNIQGLIEVYEKITKKMNPFSEEEIQPLEEVKEIQKVVEAVPEKKEVKKVDKTIPEKIEDLPISIDTITKEQEVETPPVMKVSEETTPTGVLLEELDNAPSSIIILLKWMDFLMQKVGPVRLLETLEFYENLEWISPNVKKKMLKFAEGLDKEKVKEGKSEGLSIEDHAVSLFFISKIKGYDISSDVYPSSADLKEFGISDDQ